MRKKFMAGALATVLAMGMSTAAFATTTDETTYTDQSTATFKKTYTLTNPDTISPSETFTFSALTCESVTDAADGVTKDNAPVPTIGDVVFDRGSAGLDTKNITVTLPEYTSVGIYTYSFTENVGDTAGVTYRTEPMKLVVTVLNDGDGLIRVAGVHAETADGEKTDTFADNTFSAGSLSVTKDVTGNMGDKTKEFTVKVTFTAPEGKTVKSEVSYVDGTNKTIITPSDWKNGQVTETITLKDDETVTFDNIPYGVTYTVVEEDYSDEGYDAAKYTVVDADGTEYKIDTDSEGVLITNNKDKSVDTGINLDSMPYILMMGVACAGMVVFFARKRVER